VNDQIIELLENTELRQKVMTVIKEVWSYAGTLYDNPTEDMEDYIENTEGASLWEEAWWRAETCGDIDKIEQAFYKYVIQRMAKPSRLTLGELVEGFLDLARPDEKHYTEFEGFSSDDCNNLYAIFVNYVKNHILSYRHSNPFPICAITENEVEEETVWGKNGITLRLVRGSGLIDERPMGKKLYYVLAIIEGNISTLACRDLQSEMGRILVTGIRSADLLQTERWGEYKVIAQIEPQTPLLYEREIVGIPWGEEKLIENGKPLIRQYLDAYYSDFSGKKDSIDRRIRNAVCLLIESDNQSNDSVGLALSIAAIEALLGEKGGEISTKLADNVAVLLEPDARQRYNATEFVKGLYDARSDALHGRTVEKETKLRTNARHLAAAVLSGIISRRDFIRRADFEPETPQELLQGLRKTRFDPGQPVGVEEYNVRQLWKKMQMEGNTS